MKIGRKEFVYLTGYSLYLAAISFIYNIAPSLSKFFKGGGDMFNPYCFTYGSYTD